MTEKRVSGTRLGGRWLIPTRLAWGIIVLLAGTAFSIGLVGRYHEFQHVCVLPVTVCSDQELLTPENAQSLANLGWSPQTYAQFQIGNALLSALIWCGIALLIFITRSDDWLALIVALFLFLFGTQGGYWQAAARIYPDLVLPVQFFTILSWVSFALFFALFPNGQWAPRWMRWVVLVLTIFMVFPVHLSNKIPFFFVSLIWISFFASGLFAQVYRYKRVSTITERLQTKWVLYGITISITGILAFLLTILFFPELNSPGSPMYLLVQALSGLFVLFIPISIGMAVLHSHLWDIDIIIRSTLVYGALTLTLAIVYFGGVVVLQNLFQVITGISQSPVAIVISTLLIAALFSPLRRRIQSDIDRRFYRRKYDAQKALEQLAVMARTDVELEHLTGHLLAVIQETIQPQGLSLWLRSSSSIKTNPNEK